MNTCTSIYQEQSYYALQCFQLFQCHKLFFSITSVNGNYKVEIRYQNKSRFSKKKNSTGAEKTQ